MAKKRILGKIESFNTALWHEAIRLEKLKHRCEDLTGLVDEQVWTSNPKLNLEELRSMEFALMELESKCEELAWTLDEIHDDLEAR